MCLSLFLRAGGELSDGMDIGYVDSLAIHPPFSFRLAEKITGVPGGTVPVRYGEARGIFSFEKRMSPPAP